MIRLVSKYELLLTYLPTYSLLRTSRQGFVSVVRLLVESGGNVDVVNGEGSAPLHGQRDEAKPPSGARHISPLGAAAAGSRVTLCTLGERPCHAAQSPTSGRHRHRHRRPASTKAADDGAVTTRHWAARKDHAAVVSLLLECGATRDLANERGQTPMGYAKFLGVRSRSRVRPAPALGSMVRTPFPAVGAVIVASAGAARPHLPARRCAPWVNYRAILRPCTTNPVEAPT